MSVQLSWLETQLQFTEKTLQMNTENLTEEQALIFPENGGNCINWILGHILQNRPRFFAALGDASDDHGIDPKTFACYTRGHNARDHLAEFLPMHQLKVIFQENQQKLFERMRDWESGNNDAEPILMAARLSFHEAYHAGQIGLMRRVIGLEGRIK